MSRIDLSSEEGFQKVVQKLMVVKDDVVVDEGLEPVVSKPSHHFKVSTKLLLHDLSEL